MTDLISLPRTPMQGHQGHPEKSESLVSDPDVIPNCDPGWNDSLKKILLCAIYSCFSHWVLNIEIYLLFAF